MGSGTLPSKIPVVDLSGEVLKPGSSSWIASSKAIRQALEEYSFLEVVYDKPCVEFQKQFLSAQEELFQLPYEIKKKNVYPKLAHGYLGNIPGFPECLGIDGATSVEACTNFTRLMWPDGNDRFCEIVHSYAVMASELHLLIARMLFSSYGLEKKYFEDHAKSTSYLLRVMKYEETEFKAHMDKTFMTIIYQNQVKGLEIRTKDGEWLPYVPSSRQSFAVFAGDVCMAWSNDRIKSSYHRVVASDEGEIRYSVGLFTFLKGVIEAPEELVDDEHPLQYKPFEHDGLLEFYRSNIGDPTVREWNIVKAYSAFLT